MAWYRAGIITLTNGSKEVVGSGTTWSAGVNAGDSLSLADANGAAIAPFYEIASVSDDTRLTLVQSYGGATVTGAKYCITNQAAEQTSASLDRDVTALLNRQGPIVEGAEKAKADAEAARDIAEAARDEAQTARQAAVSASGTATQAKNAAIEAKNEAVAAKRAAESAKTAAQTSATNAANSASAAASSAAQVPIASLLPAAGQVPKAGADGKIDLGWLPAGATQRTHLFINGETDAQILAATKDGDIIDRLEEV